MYERQSRLVQDMQKPAGRIVAPAVCWPGGRKPKKPEGVLSVKIVSGGTRIEMSSPI